VKNIYLDHASTTHLRKEVMEEMLPFLSNHYQNPSSLYDEGIQNKKIINSCRKRVASLLDVDSNEIYFCSGGSEANNWALKGIAFASNEKLDIITTKIEHHSSLHSCQFLKRMGYPIHYLGVDEEGFIDLTQLESLINQNTLLVSIILANNEIGTIQNIEKISRICEKNGVLLHLDAVQAIGHIPIDLKTHKVDLLSLSAHKFYGPKGVGCLYIKKGTNIENLIHGGKQEYGKRSGTESIAHIVGLTKALELNYLKLNGEALRQRELSQILIKSLTNKVNFKLNGPEIGKNRLPGIINLSFKGADASIICYLLNQQGISISTGSACNSGSIEPSHVLKAINVSDEYINGSIRISLGEETKAEDILILSHAIIDIINNKKA